MNVLLFLLISTLVVLSHQQWTRPTNLTDILTSWRGVAEPHLSTCMCRSGVKKDLLDGLFLRGEISDNPCFKCATACLIQQVNIMSSSGVVDLKVMQQVAAGVDEPIALKCGTLPGVDNCQKSYDVLSCVAGILSGRDPYPGVLPVVSTSDTNVVDTKPRLAFQYLPYGK